MPDDCSPSDSRCCDCCWPAACHAQDNSGAAAGARPPWPLSELSGVTLQVGDQKGGTESLLRAAGALDDLPYQVVFSTFTSGPPQIEAATAGKIDFAITGNTPPIFGAASNAKVKVVSAYDGGGSATRFWCTPIRRSRRSPTCGARRIAVGKGSSAHGHILGQLDKAGLTPADVKLVFLQPADALSAFTQRQADAWAIWDPYTAQAARAAAGAQHRSGQGRDQRLLVRRRIRSGAGRPETQHRAAGPAGALRKGGALGAGPPPTVGGELRRRRGPGSQGRRGRRRAEACGCRPSSTTRSSPPSRSSPTCSRPRARSPSAPKFDDWVDRRYNDALRALFVSTN